MSTYKTPDVYVEEISTLPPSVAEVSTAIPAFIGYTEKAEKNGKNLKNVPVRISSLLEFKSIFGGPDKTSFTVTVGANDTISKIDSTTSKRFLYYAVDHYFKNGGGNCYIISVGSYAGQMSKADFENGLNALAKEDEPTLILLSEATNITDTEYYDLCTQALKQCGELKDRFCILDVLNNDTNASSFRNSSIGTNNLKYGAAYFPYLSTTLNYLYDENDVNIQGISSISLSEYKTDPNGIRVTYSGSADDSPKLKVVKTGTELTFDITDGTLTIRGIGDGKTPDEIVTAWKAWSNDKAGFNIEKSGNGSVSVTDSISGSGASLVSADNGNKATLAGIKKTKTNLYSTIKNELNKFRVVLPPSPSVAGVYATVDRERGVWKAPANVSLNSVIGPDVKITANDQEQLNIDVNGGKSINAIRSFFGKGTLIWGARTLAGNDNEWRYVSVRRLFNMIEESTKKATYFAVFEPNDATTWLKVKGMIDSYLYGLWQQGALAGPAPEKAYFVNVGLGTTMTQQDILEGRMNVEIGIAAVRPAEFIILKFSHKLQEA